MRHRWHFRGALVYSRHARLGLVRCLSPRASRSSRRWRASIRTGAQPVVSWYSAGAQPGDTRSAVRRGAWTNAPLVQVSDRSAPVFAGCLGSPSTAPRVHLGATVDTPSPCAIVACKFLPVGVSCPRWSGPGAYVLTRVAAAGGRREARSSFAFQFSALFVFFELRLRACTG